MLVEVCPDIMILICTHESLSSSSTRILTCLLVHPFLRISGAHESHIVGEANVRFRS